MSAADIATIERQGLSNGIVAGIIAVSTAIAATLPMLVGSGFSLVPTILLGLLLSTAAIYTVSRRTEGRRRALDRVMTMAITSAFVGAAVPLVTVVYSVVSRGLARFDVLFFTETMRNVLGEGGGIRHAIVGTLYITGAATLISVPIGLLVAIYLVEYGRGPLAKAISWLIDVMTGIPSIVAGMFALGLFTALFGPGYRSGFAGSVALAVLMIPVVVRSVEEMLRLVPDRLREASYGLGVPRWRTILKIVVPTAAPGIVTGVILAIARVVGETAPLLVAAGITTSTNTNLFDDRMASIPLFIYNSYQNPGFPQEPSIDRAWAAALVLMLIVGILFAVARILARVLTPKGLR